MEEKDNPTPRDRDWYLRAAEDPSYAREYMAEVLARVEARMEARRTWNELSFFRRLVTRPPT